MLTEAPTPEVLLKTKVDFRPSCGGCETLLGAKNQRFRYRTALSADSTGF